MARYQVIVGNVGSVYLGEDKMSALEVFRDYCQIAKRYEGRCAGESVAIFCDEEPMFEQAARDSDEG